MVAKGYELWQKANIYVVSFQFVKNSYFKFCKVVWRRYLVEVGKFYRTLWLILLSSALALAQISCSDFLPFRDRAKKFVTTITQLDEILDEYVP